MATIFAIGDLHLPVKIQVSKFGCPLDYFEQISNHLMQINPEILLIAGDLTWGEDLENIQFELSQIKQLPGKFKFFIEGNHDVWVDRLGTSYFEAQQKMCELFSSSTLYYIGGRAAIITLDINEQDKLEEDMGKNKVKIGICGARGFAFDKNKIPSNNDLILREQQLKSLNDALKQLKSLIEVEPTSMNICLLHYPPTTQVFSDQRKLDEDFFTLIQNSGIIDKVIFGHVHIDDYLKLYTKLNHIELYCTSMDRINYNAIKVFDTD